MPPIYVEILIRAPMDSLWQHTQNPALHEAWDLRFSSITYLPRASDAEPQRFRYATRIGFGLEIVGEGSSVVSIDAATGIRVSSLTFSSNDARSLIATGSGYWKYVPTPDGIRFFTSYDYKTRFGIVGRVADRLVFRPLMGWATAFSFDALRLWLERGIHPLASRLQAAVHTVARIGLALVFVWHGLVPKLIFKNIDESAMLVDAGLSQHLADLGVLAAGVGEIAFGLLLVVIWRQRWPLPLIVFLMLTAVINVAIFSPRYIVSAFNPVSLNMCVSALAVIDFLVLKNICAASACLRKAPVPSSSSTH